MDHRHYHYAASYHFKRPDSQYADYGPNWQRRARRGNPTVSWLFRFLTRSGRLLILLFLLFMLSMLSTLAFFLGLNQSQELSTRRFSTYKGVGGMRKLKIRQDLNVNDFDKVNTVNLSTNQATPKLGKNDAGNIYKHVTELVVGNENHLVTERIRGFKSMESNESSHERIGKAIPVFGEHGAGIIHEHVTKHVADNGNNPVAERIRGVKSKESNESSYEHAGRVNNKSKATQATVLQQSDLEVCAEIENPHLIGELKSINLRDILMTSVEQEVFGKTLENVQTFVANTNELISKLNRTNPEEFPTSCYKVKGNNKCWLLFPKFVVSGAVDVSHSNYTCIAGGHWRPKDCLPRWKIAVIIPYRDRAFHLPILLRHMTPFLQRQRLEFRFFVVEQANNLKFNKAMLMNIAFVEALNFTNWDCFVFHDVDHVPINDNNYYGCSGMPKHLMAGADKWKYKIPYESLFGGAWGFTRGQMFELNGFPNSYWGWGGEDDEIYERATKWAMFTVTRVSNKIGRYNVIKQHHKSAQKETARDYLFHTYKERAPYDGLVNLNYDEPKITVNPLYTHILVNIHKLPIPGYTQVPLKSNLTDTKPDDNQPVNVEAKKQMHAILAARRRVRAKH